ATEPAQTPPKQSSMRKRNGAPPGARPVSPSATANGTGTLAYDGPAVLTSAVIRTRKPTSALRVPGVLRKRAAGRPLPPSFSHDPPGNTRRGGSVRSARVSSGSVTGPGSYGPYQSRHHCQTLPPMSKRPNGLAFFVPTECVPLPAFLEYQPASRASWAVRPFRDAEGVPARQPE